MAIFMDGLCLFDSFQLSQQFRASKKYSKIPTLAGSIFSLLIQILTIVYMAQRTDVLLNHKEANVQQTFTRNAFDENDYLNLTVGQPM